MEVRGSQLRVPFANPLDVAKKFGVQPTSGLRTQRHQNALISQGLTQTRNSSHTRGDAIDLPTPPGMSKSAFIAQLRREMPGAKIIPSNGSAVHITVPGWGKAPDVSGSRRRYPD